MKTRKMLYTMLRKEKVIVAPGCYDALSAKIVEKMGFKAAYLGGYAIGAHLGVTEPLTTLTEVVRESYYIANAIDIPLIVDANAGYGDAIHTRRAVQEFESAGVAAIHIEDQVFPKMAHYHAGTKYVIPVEEMVEKIKTALEARKNKEFLIIARTDAREAVNGGLREAIRRANIYADVGADIIMPYSTHAPNVKEAEFVAKSISAPLLYVYSEGKVGYARPTIEELENMGYKIIIYNLSAILAATKAVVRTYKYLKEKGITNLETEDMAELRTTIEELISLPKLYKIERRTKKYLRKKR